MVGRRPEAMILREVVDEALAGGTGLAVVEGEPGSGKTCLLEETAAIARRHGVLVVWASCLEGDGTPSMWPWEQALTLVLASLPEAQRATWRSGALGSIPRSSSPSMT
jgi:predicted ATPase